MSRRSHFSLFDQLPNDILSELVTWLEVADLVHLHETGNAALSDRLKLPVMVTFINIRPSVHGPMPPNILRRWSQYFPCVQTLEWKTSHFATKHIDFGQLALLPRSLKTFKLDFKLSTPDIHQPKLKVKLLPRGLHTLHLPKYTLELNHRQLLPQTLTDLRINVIISANKDSASPGLPISLKSLQFSEIRPAYYDSLDIDPKRLSYHLGIPQSLEVLICSDASDVMTLNLIESLPKSLKTFHVLLDDYWQSSIMPTYCYSFPPQLTSLVIDSKKDRFAQQLLNDTTVALLPQTLKTLVLFVHLTDAGIENLPRGITSLSLHYEGFSFKSLPRGLETLNLSAWDDAPAYCPLENSVLLPSRLNTLSLDCILANGVVDFVAALPRNLTTLSLTLELDEDDSSFNSTEGKFDLPSNLQSLDIICKRYGTQWFNSLPIGLKNLRIETGLRIYDGLIFNNLPADLTSLNIIMCGNDLSPIYMNYHCFDALPRRLTILMVKCYGIMSTPIQNTHLLKLPVLLQTLKMRTKLTLTDDVVIHLPRSLKRLLLGSHLQPAQFTLKCVQDLPPNLEELSVHTTTCQKGSHIPYPEGWKFCSR